METSSPYLVISFHDIVREEQIGMHVRYWNEGVGKVFTRDMDPNYRTKLPHYRIGCKMF